MKAAEITRALGMTPDISYDVGAAQVSFTATGEPLGRVHAETYWTAPLAEFSADDDERQIINGMLNQLSGNRHFFRWVDGTGGSIQWFVGVFLDDTNSGLTIDADVIVRLASLRISLALDIYAPDDIWASRQRVGE